MPIKRAKNKLDTFQHWFFEVGTRLVELFSAAILLSFSLKMIFRHVEIITLYPYRHFKQTEPMIFAGVALFALLQITIACKKTLRSNFGSGVLLLWAGFIYAWLTVNFSLDKPPSIEAVTSAIMAMTCFLAGREVLSLNRRVDSKNKAG